MGVHPLVRGVIAACVPFLTLACSSDEPCDGANCDATPTSAPTAAPTPTADALTALSCDVAILGGGAGGLYAAYQLGPTLGEGVCLFEKEASLGGRIHDVSPDDDPDGPWFGVGARRIMEGQTLLFELADELGMTYEAAPWTDDLIQARGAFGATSDELHEAAYPLLPAELDETALYDELRMGPERDNVTDYPDFRSYVRATVGGQGYAFLTDVFRFRADFQYTLDARGYLDYLDEEWDVCCTPSYPVGGMSAFIRGMEAAATADGVRIFKSEAVTSIDEEDGGLVVRTSAHKVSAGRVINAIPQEAFGYLDGSVAAAIQAEPEFQQLVGVKVASITQWYPTRWWEDPSARGGTVRRAWTTDSCINHIEIPVDAYGVAQNVIRTVYDDDLSCVTFWEQTAARSIDAVEEEIARGLSELYPDATIPSPDRTVVKIWPGAWYWLAGGSSFTNADIAAWAVEPLPGVALSMVGEAYNPQRSGWSDGAYKSARSTLNAHFGFAFDDTATARAARPKAPSRRGDRGRSAGGH